MQKKALLAVGLVALLQACAPISSPKGGSSMGPGTPNRALSLIAYDWHLESAAGNTGQPLSALQAKPPLQLSFTNDGLSVQGGCNTLFGDYRYQSGVLQVPNLASTMKACSPKLMARDATVGRLLKGELRTDLAGQAEHPTLTLVTTDGSVLKFAGQPTAETRYGSPAQRVFLEVAPEQVVCQDPLMPERRCLQVRERQYSEAGLLQPPQTPWAPLYAPIDGYTHDDGNGAILRVNRYDWKNPPADAPAQVYVLDMVVEQHAGAAVPSRSR